jgi:hypothetical protein
VRDGETNKTQHVSEQELQEALAALIASTKRVRRKLDLIEISEWLAIARKGLGSLRAVAERIDLSEEMLRQFASVARLSPQVRQLITDRKIESVDIAHRLSKLVHADQIVAARGVVKGDLSSDDLRAIVSLRKASPQLSIQKVIDRVKKSRNIREYLVEFTRPSTRKGMRDLRTRFVRIVGEENIRSLKVGEESGVLALNREGKKRLQAAAKRRELTKRRLIEEILHE